MSVDRIRSRHSDCDPTACVATMEQGCEPTVLLAALAEAAPAPDLLAAVEALLSEWETQSHIHTSLPTAARMFRAGLKRHLPAAPRREADR